ncbi:hypothetical protein LZ30DRAFT_739074 [Colletotrichum cereale]|nr:hypothetical protein LZ30DRAFT_739074 [Colletotrichum cereale]
MPSLFARFNCCYASDPVLLTSSKTTTVCQLQHDLYLHEHRFRTLYDLLGVPVDASQDAISTAYLVKLHGVMPEMHHCWDALVKEQEAMEKGAAARRDMRLFLSRAKHVLMHATLGGNDAVG